MTSDYIHVSICGMLIPGQVLCTRISGLTEELEKAAVECSNQKEKVHCLKKEFKETQEFIEVAKYM